MNKSIIILRGKIGQFAIVRFSYRLYLKVGNKIMEVE